MAKFVDYILEKAKKLSKNKQTISLKNNNLLNNGTS